jgi:hypothetical protein
MKRKLPSVKLHVLCMLLYQVICRFGFSFLFLMIDPPLDLSEQSQIVPWNETDHNGDSLLSKIKSQSYTNTIQLRNKPPTWNPSINCYVLNFKGRVTMASVKNFQLVQPMNESEVSVQVSVICTQYKLCLFYLLFLVLVWESRSRFLCHGC